MYHVLMPIPKFFSKDSRNVICLFFQEIEYDTYPPPEPDFVYEDPYVTEEELSLISTNPQIQLGSTSSFSEEAAEASSTYSILRGRPRKPSSGYFYFAKQHRVRFQEKYPT